MVSGGAFMSPVIRQCLRCGNCCRWPGYVRLAPEEAETIAGFLGLPVHAFTAEYTRLGPDRLWLALTESASGACVFLTDRNECRIHAVKPGQCRGFPESWNVDGFERFCKARGGGDYEREKIGL